MASTEQKIAELEKKIERQIQIKSNAEDKIKDLESKKQQLVEGEILDAIKALNMKPADLLVQLNKLKNKQ